MSWPASVKTWKGCGSSALETSTGQPVTVAVDGFATTIAVFFCSGRMMITLPDMIDGSSGDDAAARMAGRLVRGQDRRARWAHRSNLFECIISSTATIRADVG
jgi:hypothetical protein